MSTSDSNCTVASGQVRVDSGAPNGALDSTYKITVHKGKTGLSKVAERYYLQAAARKLLPGDRLAQCNRHIIPEKQFVEVKRHAGKRSAYFGNIMRCERVWTCPVCAARISENRRVELDMALRQSQKYYVALVTFTVGHHVGQSLKEVLKLLKHSYDRFMGGRVMQAIKAKHEIAGFVTALEVTHGENGWHPHQHVLVFLEWGADLALLPESERIRYLDQRIGMLELDMWQRWKHVVTASGGEVSPDAFDVRATTDAVADYVSKFGRLPSEERPSSYSWGPADEVTKAVVKKARRGGRSPFQLLADYAEGDERAGALFQEYARAMKRRHQLQWSRGLRDALGLGAEKTLDELITEDDLEADILAELDLKQWRVVLHNKARGRLLDVAATGDLNAVWDFLDSLPGMENTSLHYLHSVRERCMMRGVPQTRDEKRVKTAPGASEQGGG